MELFFLSSSFHVNATVDFPASPNRQCCWSMFPCGIDRLAVASPDRKTIILLFGF